MTRGETLLFLLILFFYHSNSQKIDLLNTRRSLFSPLGTFPALALRGKWSRKGEKIAGVRDIDNTLTHNADDQRERTQCIIRCLCQPSLWCESIMDSSHLVVWWWWQRETPMYSFWVETIINIIFTSSSDSLTQMETLQFFLSLLLRFFLQFLIFHKTHLISCIPYAETNGWTT